MNVCAVFPASPADRLNDNPSDRSIGETRVDDVDFTCGVVHPHQQYDGAPLKNAGIEAPIPIPRELTLMRASSVQRYP